jgi:hypothetical protein
VWHQLPDQLCGRVNLLAKRAKFDAYNDTDASLVPLAQIGRPQLVHGMIQSAASIPLAQYHLAGSRRIWIAVADRHREHLSRSLPSKCPSILAAKYLPLAEQVKSCYWRHGDWFIHLEFLLEHSIPFTICVQNPGDVILIGGSTLYESYDEGWNVILSVPYMVQHTHDTHTADEIVSLDTCPCPTASRRNRVVEKRARVLRVGPAIDARSDPWDAAFNSNSPLTDIMEIEEPEVEASVSRSQGQLAPSIALDGPWTNDVGASMEPVGDVVLQGEQTILLISRLSIDRLRAKGCNHCESGSPAVGWS